MDITSLGRSVCASFQPLFQDFSCDKLTQEQCMIAVTAVALTTLAAIAIGYVALKQKSRNVVDIRSTPPALNRFTDAIWSVPVFVHENGGAARYILKLPVQDSATISEIKGKIWQKLRDAGVQPLHIQEIKLHNDKGDLEDTDKFGDFIRSSDFIHCIVR